MSLYTQSFEAGGRTWYVGQRVLWVTELRSNDEDMPGTIVDYRQSRAAVTILIVALDCDSGRDPLPVRPRFLEPLS